MKRFFILCFSFLFLFGCDETGFKTGKKFIDGKTVDAKTLNLGRQVYIEYCMACHGITGEGNGPAAKGSVPPPRNFTQGIYKFGLSKDGGLPSDEDFSRIIMHGLKGTGMLAWDISSQQAFAVTQYIKTFAPQVWEKGDPASVGKPVELKQDPWGLARSSSAVERGKEVYHAVTSCQSCHMSYVSPKEFSDINKKINGQTVSSVDPSNYELKQQDSEYFLHEHKDQTVKNLPPDFTWNEIRSASTVSEIALRICAGVSGTGMPAWCGTVSDDDVWALAYYVKSLTELKGNTKARDDFIKTVRP